MTPTDTCINLEASPANTNLIKEFDLAPTSSVTSDDTGVRYLIARICSRSMRKFTRGKRQCNSEAPF